MTFYLKLNNLFPGSRIVFRALLPGVLSILLASACTKNDAGVQPTTTNLPQLVADNGPADALQKRDQLAFTDRSAGPKEVVGVTLYDYGIYLQDTHEPYDLVAPELREAVRQYHLSMTRRYGNISDLRTLAAELEQDQLVPKGQSLDFYVDFVEHVERQKFTSFGQFWFYLRELEQIVQNSTNYTVWEKDLLMNYCVLARYTMKYGYAQGKIFSQQVETGKPAEREACDETKCVLKTAGLDVLLGTLGGAAKGLLTGSSAGPAGAAAGAAVGAFVGFFKGLVGSIHKCDCYDSECVPPIRYRIEFSNCNLTTQRIIFMGQGSKVTSFNWTMVNGTATELGGGGSGTTATPSLTITQVDPNLPVDIFLTYTCNNKPYLQVYKIDIRGEVEGGTSWIEGPTPIAAGSEVMYAIAGTCLANPFNTNYHINVLNSTGHEVGTVTTNSGTSCVIRWNYMPFETHGDEWWGNVVGGFTNQCINANRGLGLQVIITRSGTGQSN